MFICLVCEKVYADTCPTCPDRGDGRGVTVEAILQAFRDSPTVGDVNSTVKHFARHVAILDKAGGKARTEAIIIRNLAGYRRWQIGEPWKKR